MIELNSVPNIPLKVIFAVHFILISWGIQGFWSPDSYLFYNFFFLIVLLWSMHAKDSDEPLQMAIFLNGIAVVLDLITITFFFHRIGGGGDKFSLLMAVVNLVFRPVSILLLGKICADRMGLIDGAFPTSFGAIFGQSTLASSAPGQRRSYENIDSFTPSSLRQPPNHQSIPETIYQQP